MADQKAPAETPAAPARALPSHIILLADHGAHMSGRVLRADADLIAQLDAEHAPYRAATESEVSIGAFGG